ncbi:hypothetical protein Trydic_g9735 [Trypoxylus dichotomus]
MSGVTVDILLETVMGYNETRSKGSSLEYALAVMKKEAYLLKEFNVVNSKTNLIPEEDSKVEKEGIQGYNNGTAVGDDLDKNDGNDVGEKRHLAFLDTLIEALQQDQNLTEQEVRDQVSTIMFEGHDTTAAGSGFVLCMLGYPENEASGKSYYGNAEVPIIARKLNEDLKLVFGNYTIPAGSTVIIPPVVLHRNAKSFPNPDIFNPDNFLPEKCHKRHFYSYIPFSAGPRSCVGRKYAMLKLKVLRATILRRFKVVSTVKEKDFVLQADIILKRTDGVMIRLEDRQNIY